MNRDALLATIIGFGVGLLIMGVLLIGPKLSLPNFNLFGPRQETGVPAPSASQILTIDSPLADAIEGEKEVLLSGKAAPAATIVIAGPLGEAVTQATPEGTWAGRAALTEGANELVVTMYDKERTENLTITVYYTPEEF